MMEIWLSGACASFKEFRDWSKSTGVGGGGGVGRSMRKSEGPKTHDPPPFMGIKSADPPPDSG